jgi:tRNA A-37 threonylcarbamoyl transferase component Bud32
MNLTRGRCGGWAALVAPEGTALCHELAGRRNIRQRCSRILRDDQRSFVGLLELGGESIVAKSPREKDRGRWSRLVSLGRESHAFRSLRALAALEAAGVPSARGLLALERRQAGHVIESWLFTRWVEGTPCTAADVPDVIALLERMHRAGWVHGDAHIQNFVRGSEGVQTLDPGPHRQRFGQVSAAYDLILLRNSRADVGVAFERAQPEAPGSAAFRIASAYDDLIHRWRRLKRTARQWVGGGEG